MQKAEGSLKLVRSDDAGRVSKCKNRSGLMMREKPVKLWREIGSGYTFIFWLYPMTALSVKAIVFNNGETFLLESEHFMQAFFFPVLLANCCLFILPLINTQHNNNICSVSIKKYIDNITNL